MIYHITSGEAWRTAYREGAYRAPSLETDGFIHFSTGRQVLRVANAFYRELGDSVLLCVEETKLHAPRRYEAPVHPEGQPPAGSSDQERFPHVYGPLNLDAIVMVYPLWQDATGFVLPPLDE